jgi:hypothetical protein
MGGVCKHASSRLPPQARSQCLRSNFSQGLLYRWNGGGTCRAACSPAVHVNAEHGLFYYIKFLKEMLSASRNFLCVFGVLKAKSVLFVLLFYICQNAVKLSQIP